MVLRVAIAVHRRRLPVHHRRPVVLALAVRVLRLRVIRRRVKRQLAPKKLAVKKKNRRLRQQRKNPQMYHRYVHRVKSRLNVVQRRKVFLLIKKKNRLLVRVVFIVDFL